MSLFYKQNVAEAHGDTPRMILSGVVARYSAASGLGLL